MPGNTSWTSNELKQDGEELGLPDDAQKGNSTGTTFRL